MRNFLLLLICFSLPAILWGKDKTPTVPNFNFERNYSDFCQLPNIVVKNPGTKEIAGTIKLQLRNSKDKVLSEQTIAYQVPAGGTEKIDITKTLKTPKKIVLLTAEAAELKAMNAGCRLPKTEHIISGIFGPSGKIARKQDCLISMNVHIRRYTPELRWKLMQMLRKCGVKSVRVEISFGDPDNTKLVQHCIAELEETVLGLEAFGIEPMVIIAWFNRKFYRSGSKMDMAYRWAKIFASHFKGRVSWHYGNEVNCGWAAYGAAADMAALNKSFALGTKAGDAKALAASFGIAEGLYHYVKEFFKCDVLNYLDAICVHPYCGTPEAGMAKCLATKKLIASYGSNAQVWATEIGFHIDENSSRNEFTGELTGVMGFSKLHQRQLLSRLFVLARSYGIERIYWYDFFGLKDRETFWLVDKNLKPLPSYYALVESSKRLKNTVSAGYTPVESLVQRHVFKRTDGSILLACWALKNGTKADFKLPENARIFDGLGHAVKLPENGILTLGHGVFYIEGITVAQLPKLINKDVIISTMDKRHFGAPMSRFTVKAGSDFTVPFAAFNGCKKLVVVKPLIKRTYPGWKISVPADMMLAAEQQKSEDLKISVPADAVPGVEYLFSFGADVNELQMTYPYPVRVKVAGEFPYSAIERFNRPVNYPIWDAMNETKVEKGNPLLTANQGRAVIDGDLKEWKAEEFYPIDQKFQWKLRDPGIPSDDDWSGKVALRWDSKYIYAAFLVKDEQLCFVDFLSRDWRDSDNIRLFFSSVENEKKRTRNITDNDLLLIMTPTGISHTEGPMLNVASLGGKVRSRTEGKIKMSSKVWKNGYVLEVAVPVSEFNLEPKAGMKIGFNCMADDIDNGFRQHVAMTYFKNLNYWNSPKSLGKLLLK